MTEQPQPIAEPAGPPPVAAPPARPPAQAQPTPTPVGVQDLSTAPVTGNTDGAGTNHFMLITGTTGAPTRTCGGDSQPWPCDTILAIATREAEAKGVPADNVRTSVAHRFGVDEARVAAL